MDYSLQQRTELIIAECMKTSSTNPYEIFNIIAHKDFVSTHGPEHHVLDGACILTAFYNAGGVVELDAALQKLMSEGLKMPGAVCGLWGVCGAVMSIGAALAIIDGSGPLSTEDWGSHMEYTSQALTRLAKIGGPRCCKRDAFSSMELAIGYIKKRYGITLDMPHIKCDFASKNAECIGERCPYNI
ncbi:MAG: hypothetical protein J1E83_08885 [Lachnospiraceae bacterium]|nr:hypothetical protein [Lachnospiraceae bacterium]